VLAGWPSTPSSQGGNARNVEAQREVGVEDITKLGISKKPGTFLARLSWFKFAVLFCLVFFTSVESQYPDAMM
jgi:hypothetical protein